ncbi:MAG TPA: class IV adenylate cyclase [Anaerolineae bacterium]|nr:class IV adenylate cyclase [Anaerolineae bacterium]
MSGSSLETEVKFRAADLVALRTRLLEHGAIVTQSRHLERNTLFDDAENSLAARGMLLRLRSALETRLTLKAPAPADQQSGQHKARVEIEITVSDYAATYALLTTLGYTPGWRYEKYRESFRLEEAIVSLDHTPIGDFVEIEGPPDAIRQLSERLGFEWETRNLQTYRDLFSEAKMAGQTDMVFERETRTT